MCWSDARVLLYESILFGVLRLLRVSIILKFTIDIADWYLQHEKSLNVELSLPLVTFGAINSD